MFDGVNLMSFKKVANQLNNLTYTDYYLRLKMLATSMFKWSNLPNGMDEKWIEMFLFNKGSCVFYEDDKRGLMVAECTHEDTNNYNEPSRVSPHGIDIDETKSLVVNEECILIKNNDLMLPTSYFVNLFAYRLAQITRTIDVNIHAQKTPYIIVSNNKNLLTMKNVYAKVENNEVAIVVDKNLDLDNVKVLQTDAPIVFPQLQVQKQTLWNECLTFLGLNNANTDKRERLISDEVEANNEHIEMSAEIFLKSRQRAAEQINTLFKCDCKVELRKEVNLKCMQNTPQVLEN